MFVVSIYANGRLAPGRLIHIAESDSREVLVEAAIQAIENTAGWEPLVVIHRRTS